MLDKFGLLWYSNGVLGYIKTRIVKGNWLWGKSGVSALFSWLWQKHLTFGEKFDIV